MTSMGSDCSEDSTRTGGPPKAFEYRTHVRTLFHFRTEQPRRPEIADMLAWHLVEDRSEAVARLSIGLQGA